MVEEADGSIEPRDGVSCSLALPPFESPPMNTVEVEIMTEIYGKGLTGRSVILEVLT